ncbi:hypothetical protein NKG94_48905 [Micromonospora sp. M12]
MVNTSARSQGWAVRLEFSGGRLVTTWVEGVPQGTLRETDDGFTYVSGVDVRPGGSVSLRFHMERTSSTPRDCTVDGVRCGGSERPFRKDAALLRPCLQGIAECFGKG